MEIELKEITLDQLRRERPDLVGILKEDGIKKERLRVLEIYKRAQSMFSAENVEPIMPIIMKALDDGWSVVDFSEEISALLQEANIANRNTNNTNNNQDLSHLARARIYQLTHGCSITDALRATATPR
jgi:hypothetical protein